MGQQATSKQKMIESLREGIRQLAGKPNAATELAGLRSALSVLEGRPLPKVEHVSASKRTAPRAGHSNDPRLRAMDLQVRRAIGENTVTTKSIGSLQFAGVPADYEPNT